MQPLDQIDPYRPSVLAPGRGRPVSGHAAVDAAISAQRAFVGDMWRHGSLAATGATGLRAVMTALEAETPREWRSLPLWPERLPFAASRIMEAGQGRSLSRIWTPDRAADLKSSI